MGCSSSRTGGSSSKPKYLFIKNADFAESNGLYYLTRHSREGKPVYKMMNNCHTKVEHYLRYGRKSGWYIGPQLDDRGYFFSDISVPKVMSEEITTNPKGIEIRPVTDTQLYVHDRHTFLEVTVPEGGSTDSSGVYRKTSMEFNSCPIYKMVGTSRTGQDRFLQFSAKHGWSIGATLQGSQCLYTMDQGNIVPWADSWSKGGVNIVPCPDGQLPELAQAQALGSIKPDDSSKNLLPGSLKELKFDVFAPLPDPWLPSQIEITFVVSAHHMMDSPQRIPAEKVSIDYLRQVFTEEHYDYENARIAKSSDMPTVFIVHGFCNDADTEWMETMKEAFVDRYGFKCNIIKVGWGKGAKFPHYPQAVANTQAVANAVATFVNTLVINDIVDPTNIHLVGHSLGAHICGQAGRMIAPNLSRVTGLDPAGPFFERANEDLRLGADSAPFVDVIHTHGGGSAVCYGTMNELGDVDFYPNGGTASQPGCNTKDDLIGRSHGRAYDYFTESITALEEDKKFWARSERGVLGIPMGFHAGDKEYRELIKDNPDHGPFYLDTSDTPSFSMGRTVFTEGKDGQ